MKWAIAEKLQLYNFSLELIERQFFSSRDPEQCAMSEPSGDSKTNNSVAGEYHCSTVHCSTAGLTLGLGRQFISPGFGNTRKVADARNMFCKCNFQFIFQQHRNCKTLIFFISHISWFQMLKTLNYFCQIWCHSHQRCRRFQECLSKWNYIAIIKSSGNREWLD